MESTSLAHDMRHVQNKAQVMGSLIQALRAEMFYAKSNANTTAAQYVHALDITWAEVTEGIHSLAEHIEYLSTLCEQNNIPELLFSLQSNPEHISKQQICNDK